MQVDFWKTSRGKTLQAAIYISASAFIGAVVSAIVNDPQLFGFITPIINIVLVLVKNLIDKNVPN